ncbi:MAG TPA: LPS export ABC transporter ATP-binding protein [Longimicrobiales bacterium]|nr:LPS export ABC transporter ATP-binding protein [Longimicrobiales bacterium]
MTLREYAAGLKPHDASVAIALHELVRMADGDGVVERGDWLTAIRAAYVGYLSDGREGAGLLDSAGTTDSPDEPARYLDDHVMPRLQADGVAAGRPEGDAWDRVQLLPPYSGELAGDREALARELDATVRILLHGQESGRSAAREPGAELVPGGSTLSARGLVKAYRRRRVVSDVDVQVSQGEIVGLLGPNGAGKTTTFYMVVGLISPDRGKVFLDEQELTRWPMYKRARAGVGYLAQEPSIFRKLTVEENILAILETLGLKRSERRARLERLLDELGLRHLRKAKAYSLSGGERRRLEITRALVAEPKFMLLDEPFAGVDPIAVHDIQQIVAELRHRGIGVIISDHNVEQTLDIVDRAYIMYDGKVRVSGTVAELVWNEEVAEIYFGPTLTARMRERYPRPELVV